MNNKAVISGLALSVVAAVWFFMAPGSDEAQIDKALDQIESILSKTGPENPVLAAASLRALSDYIVAEPRIEIRSRSDVYTDLNSLIGMAAGFRARLDRITVSIGQRRIAVSPEGTRAEVTATGTAHAVGTGIDERHSGRARLEWSKIDGDWKITSCTRIE